MEQTGLVKRACSHVNSVADFRKPDREITGDKFSSFCTIYFPIIHIIEPRAVSLCTKIPTILFLFF